MPKISIRLTRIPISDSKKLQSALAQLAASVTAETSRQEPEAATCVEAVFGGKSNVDNIIFVDADLTDTVEPERLASVIESSVERAYRDALDAEALVALHWHASGAEPVSVSARSR